MKKAGIIIEAPMRPYMVEARAAINDILMAQVEDETKREALKTLREVSTAGPITITNCTVAAPK